MNDDSSIESSVDSPLSSLSGSPEKRIRNRTFEYMIDRNYNDTASIIDISIDSREDSDLIQVYPLEIIHEETDSLITGNSIDGFNEIESDESVDFNEFVDFNEEEVFNFFEERKTTFSKLLFFMVTSFYIYGLMTGSNFESISPKNKYLYYRAISYWPECNDLRDQIWRMLTSTLVHSGISHIFFNLLFLLPISFSLEKFQKSIHLFIITIIGCLHTSISFYLLKPYNSVIGCSNIVFIFFGSFLSNNILNSDLYFDSISARFCSFIIILMFLMMEVLGYFFYYSENTAYICHWMGFLSGLFGGLSFFKIFIDSNLKSCLVGFSRIIYTLLTILLIYNYIIGYPPLQSYDEKFNKIMIIDCCYEWNKFKFNNNVDDSFFNNFTCPYTVDYGSFI